MRSISLTTTVKKDIDDPYVIRLKGNDYSKKIRLVAAHRPHSEALDLDLMLP